MNDQTELELETCEGNRTGRSSNLGDFFEGMLPSKRKEDFESIRSYSTQCAKSVDSTEGQFPSRKFMLR